MALVKPSKNGGPYSKSEREDRQNEVYNLHFEYGYPKEVIKREVPINMWRTSTKFADIFKLNSINIGLVPIETSSKNVEALFNKIENNPKTNIYISIEEKSVKCEEIEFSFDLDDFSQNRILKGLDKIDITLEYISDIENFSKSRKDWKPKLT